MTAITAEQKGQIVKDYQRAPGDTGSPEVQVALLSARITHLTDHFSTHKQDHHSRQGLLRQIDRNPTGVGGHFGSTIPGMFQGWGPNTVIALANGQSWQISDGSTGYIQSENVKVKIRRAFMGSFVMEFEGSNRVAKVRRVK